MKRIILSLVVAAMLPLAVACTKQATTRTVGLNFGPLSCSVETSSEKLDVNIDKVFDAVMKAGKIWSLFDEKEFAAEKGLERYKAQCKELFELFAENSE